MINFLIIIQDIMKTIMIVTRNMLAGGAERVIAQLANYFVSKNYNCYLVTLYKDGITHIFNFSGKESILIINAITIALFCVIKDEIKSLVYIEVKKLLVISAWISILFYVIDLFNIPCWGKIVKVI